MAGVGLSRGTPPESAEVVSSDRLNTISDEPVRISRAQSLPVDFRGVPSHQNARVIVVAGSLPVIVDFTRKSLVFSEGGVNRALRTLKGVILVGYVAAPLSEQTWLREELNKYGWHPVFLPKEDADVFFQDFSNNLLYSVFHYMPLPMTRTDNMQDAFKCYQRANEIISSVVLRVWEPGDLVWVHDYHLLLLPDMLRKVKPTMRIGYFLHIPFPSSEIYRTLPNRSELLNGVLGADLIGLQIHEYARHFESACVRVLGVHANFGQVVRGKDHCSVITCPIGIEPTRFEEAVESKQVKEIVAKLETDFKGRKVLLGFDRFDHVKGIPHKLYALERFLKDHPEWIGRVVLLQVASAWNKKAPKSEEYKALVRQVHEIVGRINGRFGTLSSMPIHYLQQSVSFEQLVALYRVADALVISSIRDGMNLVAHEYVTCQKGKHGVLILSEFTGASKSLGAGSLQVNPWNVESFGSTLRYALEMPAVERERLHKYAYRYVQTHTTSNWARTFLSTLRNLQPNHDERYSPNMKAPVNLDIKAVAEAFRQAKKRVVITGLGGTLTPSGMGTDTLRMPTRNLRRTPSIQAKLHNVSAKVKSYIETLAQDPNTIVVVISNATREELLNIFGDSDVWLAPENGFFLRRGKDDVHWHVMFDSIDLSWKERVKKVFQYFTERTPQTFMSEHETSCAWHYHDAQRGFADKQANDLMIHLRGGILSNTSTEIQDTSSVIQIRPAGLSKGASILKILHHYHKWRSSRRDLLDGTRGGETSSTQARYGLEKDPVDFVLCIGNITKLDEDLFDLCNELKYKPLRQVYNKRKKQKKMRSAPTPYSTTSYNHDASSNAATTSDTRSNISGNSDNGKGAEGKVEGMVEISKSIPTPHVAFEKFSQIPHDIPTPSALCPLPTRPTPLLSPSSSPSPPIGATPPPRENVLPPNSVRTPPLSTPPPSSPRESPRERGGEEERGTKVFTCAVGRKKWTHAESFVESDLQVKKLLSVLAKFTTRSTSPVSRRSSSSSLLDRKSGSFRGVNSHKFRSGGVFVRTGRTGAERIYLNRNQLSADSGFWYF